MITCESCGSANPMGTRWCRQCGAKLNIDAKQVEASVAATNADAADDRLVGWGRSAIGLGGFLLVAVVILRVALVPALPPAEIPTNLPAEVIPPLSANVTTAAAALGGDGNTVVASQRLRWRATVCRTLANGLGLDLAAMDKVADDLAAAQKADGSWAGGSDPLAATALATLALQAWPSDARLGRALRARTWLKTQLTDATRRTPLGRTMAIAALEDAEALGSGERARLLAYIMDGKVAKWQAWLMAEVPAAERPPQLGLISDGLAGADDVWRWHLQLVGGTRPEITAGRFFVETVGTVPAEDRLPWTLLAWQMTPAPADLGTILQGWSRAAPPDASPELTAATGPLTADALWLMALAAPAYLPPLWGGTAVLK